MALVLLVIGGFLIAKMLSGVSEGEQGILPSLIVRNIHIHHWTWASLTTILLLYLKWYSLAAFMVGITIQGLTYSDRFNFKQKR